MGKGWGRGREDTPKKTQILGRGDKHGSRWELGVGGPVTGGVPAWLCPPPRTPSPPGQVSPEPPPALLGSDEGEQEDPRDYCKGGDSALIFWGVSLGVSPNSGG